MIMAPILAVDAEVVTDSKTSASSLPSPSSPFRPNDVLMGRGSGPNRWKGNILFRDLVLKTFQDYVVSSASDQETKKKKTSKQQQQQKQPQQQLLPLPLKSFSSLDPFVKNQLAKSVLHAIEEKRGRFLQKMTKEEFEGEYCNKSNSTKIDGSGVPTILHQEEEEGKGVGETGEEGRVTTTTTTYVYIEATEKKAMEKIKQTFRFLNDQKQARRQSKVAAARRMSDEAVKASFATATAATARNHNDSSASLHAAAASASDRMRASPLRLHNLLSPQAAQHVLQGAVGSGNSSLLASLLARSFSGPAASLAQMYSSSGMEATAAAAAGVNQQSASSLASLLMAASSQQRNNLTMSQDVAAALQIQAERKRMFEQEMLLASSLRAARIKEVILRQQLFPQHHNHHHRQQQQQQLQQQLPSSSLSNQQLLELARRLNMDASLPPSDGQQRHYDKPS